MMKAHNRLAAVLSSAMLVLNSISVQSAFAVSNEFEKTGMTLLISAGADGWGSEELKYVIPDDADFDSYYLYVEYESMPHFELNLCKSTESYQRTGNVTTTTVEDTVSTISMSPSRQSGFYYFKVSDASRYLLSFSVSAVTPTELTDGSKGTYAFYGHRADDTPDPSLSEITGTTTGTAVVGHYEPDYDPWFTDEHGNMMNRGTNAYYGSTLDITSEPKRLFALGEPFSTEGLKVTLTEERRFNSRVHDISDCLQIRTDYDPYEPGEYIVYIRTDYRDGEISSDDSLFYTVIVDGNLTYVSHEGGTEEFRSETTETLSDVTLAETDDSEASVSTDESETSFTETTTTEQGTQTETGFVKLPGDVDRNGQVAIADAVLLARYLAEDAVYVSEEGLINAELDGDDSALSSSDLSMLLQIIAGTANL